MARITLTKKGIVLLFFILFAIGAVGTYVVIRINQENQRSQAANPACSGHANGSVEQSGCKGQQWCKWLLYCDANENATGTSDPYDCADDSRCTVTPPSAHCSNGVKDDDETGVDCGGSDCNPCSTGTCNNNGSCDSGETNSNCPADCPTSTGVTCTCRDFNNNGGCGTGCTFTGINCQARANSTGKAQIAMCPHTNQPTCADYVPGQVCYDTTGAKADVCENPIWTPERKTCWQTGCTNVGCSDGSTCVSDRCINTSCPNDSDCNCGGTTTEYLNIKGRVYCQDPGGPVLPVTNVKVQFYKDGALGGTRGTEVLTTDANGYFTSAANTTQKKDGDFAVRLDSTSLTGRLSNGQPYSTMVNSSKNSATCTQYCNGCAANDRYELCAKFPNSGTVQSFDILFTNCTPETPQPLCGDGILGNTDNEQCELGDPTGVSCSWATCNQLDCSCPSVNPSWSITKQATPVCINPNTENVAARVNYAIVVTNTSTTAGTLNRVVDTPAGMQYSWLELNSINPSYGVAAQNILNGGFTITWNLSGAEAQFAAGQSKTYRYSVVVPRASFGTYTNTAIGYPGTDDSGSFTANDTTVVSCYLPNNGILDEPLGRMGLGLILLGVGLAYVYIDRNNNILRGAYKFASPVFVEDVKIERSRSKFERKFATKTASKKRK